MLFDRKMEEQLLELTQNGKYKEVQRILESMSDKQVRGHVPSNTRCLASVGLMLGQH